ALGLPEGGLFRPRKKESESPSRYRAFPGIRRCRARPLRPARRRPLMRSVVLVPEAGQASGPDLTRYLVVCAGSILALLALAWLFRRYVAGHLRARAARRSLQVLDVLPLSGKQKLVVVSCYDRSFLLGLVETEGRAIAELDGATLAQPEEAAAGEVVEGVSPFPSAMGRPATGRSATGST